MRICIFILFLLLLSCEDESEKNFYDWSRVRAHRRLPLVYPYDIWGDYFGREIFWGTNNLVDTSPKYSVGEIDSVGIAECVIALHSSDHYHGSLGGGDPDTVWFIFDVKNHEELSFISLQDYLNCLKKKKINKMKFYEINEVYKTFDSLYVLPPEWPRQPKK